MDLEYVSVESSKYRREYFPPDPNRVEADRHNSAEPDPNLSEETGSEVANPQIDRVLHRISIASTREHCRSEWNEEL